MIKVSIPYLLRRAAFKFPDREAIISESGRWNYKQWEQYSNKRARALARHGIRKGDHVATLFFNGNEVLETFLALLKLGAVIVPLNVRHSSKELRYVLDHSDATAIVFSHEFESIIREIKGELPKVTQYFFCGIDGPDDMVEFGETYKNESGEDVNTEIEEKDIAFILYTAGTTGQPKGVLLSHSNWIWTATNAILDADVQTGDRALLVFPLYHAGAILILTVNLYMACSNVTVKSFDPKRVMELMEKEKITRMAFPPTVWNFILQVPNLDRYDTSSVRYIGSGSESMPLETKKKLLNLFHNAGIGETYGMTEAGTVSSLNPKFALTKMASVGKAAVNTEIRLVNNERKDVLVGEVGEILVRGPSVMAGYYKDHEATSRAIRDGWLHTGDFGRLDGDGFLFIVDRKKDMIITGGENVYPREIEEVLYGHPKILEAAVIGLPDPAWGEKIHAVIAVKDGELLDEQEVINYTKENLSSFKKPKSIRFVDRLPRSPTGKVLKYVIREQEKSSE